MKNEFMTSEALDAVLTKYSWQTVIDVGYSMARLLNWTGGWTATNAPSREPVIGTGDVRIEHFQV